MSCDSVQLGATRDSPDVIGSQRDLQLTEHLGRLLHSSAKFLWRNATHDTAVATDQTRSRKNTVAIDSSGGQSLKQLAN